MITQFGIAIYIFVIMPRLGIVAIFYHVTRSRFLNERITAGRHGGPFLENAERTILRVGGNPGGSDYHRKQKGVGLCRD